MQSFVPAPVPAAAPSLPAGALDDIAKAKADAAAAKAAIDALAASASGGGVETYIGSVQIYGNANPFNLAALVPTSQKGNRATSVLIECVGGGGSGYACDQQHTLASHGGNPGQVTHRRMRVADLPASVPNVNVGPGGAAANQQPGAAYANSREAPPSARISRRMAGSAASTSPRWTTRSVAA